MLLALLTAARRASADTGVLIPRDKSQPDLSVLSLDEMEIDIRIDNGDARVWVRQIFLNHTASIEEGNYVFALPSRTTVSDFAVWDGPVRIPAVILERKGGALYSLRALQDEQALNFTAAEADWKSWVEHTPDRAEAELDLAAFYDRRLRYQDEIAALTAVAQSPATPAEKFVISSEQRSWRAFEHILTVIQQNAPGSDATDKTYHAWIRALSRRASRLLAIFR